MTDTEKQAWGDMMLDRLPGRPIDKKSTLLSEEEEAKISVCNAVAWAWADLEKEACAIAGIPWVSEWMPGERPDDFLSPDGSVAQLARLAEKWHDEHNPKQSAFMRQCSVFCQLGEGRADLVRLSKVRPEWIGRALLERVRDNETFREMPIEDRPPDWKKRVEENYKTTAQSIPPDVREEMARAEITGAWLVSFAYRMHNLIEWEGKSVAVAFEEARRNYLGECVHGAARLFGECLHEIDLVYTENRVRAELAETVALAEAEMYKAQGRAEAEAEARKRAEEARAKMEAIARREAAEKARLKAEAKTGKAFDALAGKVDSINDKAAEILDRQKGAENSRTRDGDLLEAIRRYDRERGAGNDEQTARDVIDDLRGEGMWLPIQPKTLQNRHAEWVAMGRPGTLAEYQQGKAEEAAKRKQDRKARKARKAGRK